MNNHQASYLVSIDLIFTLPGISRKIRKNLLKFEKKFFLLTVDNHVKLSRDFEGFQEVMAGWKTFFDLSMFDILIKNKGHLIYHVVLSD